jgi:hypothetical protein
MKIKLRSFIMKRIVSVLLVVTLLISFVPCAFADDNFKVSHTDIKSNDDIKTIDVVLPIFEGFSGADEINKKILNIALDAIGDANSTAKAMLPLKKELIEKGEAAASMVVYLNMTYDYVKLGEILSVQLNIDSYSGGAHGISQIVSITSNTSTGEIYEFKDLFKEDADYNSVITNLILHEVEKDSEMYFPNYEETIISKNGNYEFYIDGDKLVVYFGLYDIAPYASGIRHFLIDSGDIKDMLKDEVNNSIKDGKERGIINYNGKDINSNKGTANSSGTILLPLRVIAEALGYKVDWNKKDGAIVAGKPVSITPQAVIDGATYVPTSYFRDVLSENVSLGVIGNDKIIVRAYGKVNIENSNYKLASEYESPKTVQEAVNMYAEAVKMRNGFVQYALLDDKMRDERYDDYKGFSFVTGVSSPWIDSYEIKQPAENLYQIKFTYRTSVPTDGTYTSDINVRLIEDGEYVKITSIE